MVSAFTESRMDYFASNLEVIASQNPRWARQLDHMRRRIPPSALPDHPEEPPADFPLKLHYARNGQVTARARNGVGRWMQIHSAYDPAKEAQQFAEGIEWGEANYNVVFGLGLGYVAEELVQRMRPTDKLLLYEPSLEMFALALMSRDLRSVLARPGTALGVAETVNLAVNALMSKFSIAEFRGVRMISFPGFENLPNAHLFTKLQEGLRAQLFAVGGNFQTLMAMGASYQYNTLLSFRAILENPPFQNLIGRFRGIPAVVVSTGPSLDKNVELLNEIRDRALIIAVETSLKPLLKRGIEPHIVCTGDPQEANYRHIKGTDAPNTYLVVEPQAPPKSIAEWTGRVFICSFGDFMMRWVESVIGERGTLKSWGSVATMAYDIALKVGADPIIFIGQDLSFPEGRTYARGTYFEDEDQQQNTVEELRERGTYLIEKTDIYGRQVFTNKQMYSYCNYFHARFAEPEARQRTIINATEGGILKEGVRIMTFREAINGFLREPQPISGLLDEAWRSSSPVNLRHVELEVGALLSELREFWSHCEKGIISATKLAKAAAVAEETGAGEAKLRELLQFYQRLPKLRAQMVSLRRVVPFVQAANQTGLYAFNRRARELADREPEFATLVAHARNFHTLFTTCLEIVTRLTPLFERARDTTLELIRESKQPASVTG